MEKGTVVLTPSDDNIAPLTLGSNLFFNMPGHFRGTKFHMHILSDEKINVGDWCVMLDSMGNVFSNPQQYTNSDTQFINDGHRKIVSTTDKSIMVPVLANPNHTDPVMTFLPEPSNEFINDYINSDVEIKNVLFETKENKILLTWKEDI